MLVLSRKVGESIVIDETIQIEVIDVQRGKVRLGIKAPSHVRVDRQEIHERRHEFQIPVSDEPLFTAGADHHRMR